MRAYLRPYLFLISVVTWFITKMDELAGLFASQFTLSAEEQEEIVVDKGETGNIRTRHLLVGQALSLKPISREGLLNVFKPLWKDSGLRVGGLGGGKIVFEVSSIEIKQRVLDGSPWSFDKFLLILAEANGRGPPEKIPLSVENFWVQVHGLDPDDLTEEIGEQVGCTLGKYKETDLGADGICQTKYLRIRVSLDVYKPLRRVVKVRIDGHSSMYQLKYERLPHFCFICGMLDHRDVLCNQRNESIPIKQQHQFGLFLKAEEEGSVFQTRRTNLFFEPVQPMWMMKAPEFIDSLAGTVRNRDDFELEVEAEVQDMALEHVPMETVETQDPRFVPLEPLK